MKLLIIRSFLSVALKSKTWTDKSIWKYLDVIIDRSLSWEEHINILRTKVSRAIGFLIYARNFFLKTHSVKCLRV